jgi:dTDP-4-dehydrorhamnose 3,5-epimerase
LQIINTSIPGLVLLEPRIFRDSRGYFLEAFRKEMLIAAGIDAEFVQDNESGSAKNVLRGLHFQLPPHAQGKLVRVVRGAAQDVAVDLRVNSPTYGKWHSEILSVDNKRMMWVPEGFAHAFLTLEDNTVFQYKCSAYYHPGSERTIRWNDPALAIVWASDHPIVSDKDSNGIAFRHFNSPFQFSI